MASSTTKPEAMTRAMRVRLLSEKPARGSAIFGGNSQKAGASGTLSMATRTMLPVGEQGDMRTLKPSILPEPLRSISVPVHTSSSSAREAACISVSPNSPGAMSSSRKSSPLRPAHPKTSCAASLQVTISHWRTSTTITGYCTCPKASWQVRASPSVTNMTGRAASMSKPK